MATFPKPSPGADAERAIRTLAADWVKHHNGRNMDKLLSVYSNDARMLAPHRPSDHGASGLRQYYEDQFRDQDPRDSTVEVEYVEAGDDIAFSTGKYTVNVRLPDGKRLDDHGKWTVVLRRIGTGWRVVAHCWNTDLPMTAYTT